MNTSPASDPENTVSPNKAVDVLIVGAGPTGLAAAIELGIRGVRVLVVDGNPRSGMAPRAKTTNVRTRTHLRRWGIADRLAAAAPFGVHHPNDMIFVTRLAGRELARFDDAFNASPERSPFYPEHAQWVPQYTLERTLLERATELSGVDINFGTQLVSATQDDGSVAATLLEGQTERVVNVSYLIGADGARSRVRELIGARMIGRRGLHTSYNIIFRAPGLAAAHSFGLAAAYWQMSRDGFSTIGPMDQDDIWFFMPSGARPDEHLDEAAARALIVQRTGIDLPYEILSADSWTANELVADRYRDHRMLLAGDACHLHPPAGGYGMNMGIGDGVDLGWKIAAMLAGWGGPLLLDSYEAERRPVHKHVIAEAMANFAIYVADIDPAIEDEGIAGDEARKRLGDFILASKGREFRTLGTVLGLGYEDSPLTVREPNDPLVRNLETYSPTSRPGHLLPHAWLPDGRSLYDLLGNGFSLLAATDAAEEELARAERDAATLRVPLAVVRPEGVDVRALCEATLVLVRPDQHVAWRGHCWSDVLGIATGHGSEPANRASGSDASVRSVALASGSDEMTIEKNRRSSDMQQNSQATGGGPVDDRTGADPSVFVKHSFEERQIDLGEISMNYAETGDAAKPALLLIPGQSESWWGYEAAMKLLASDFHIFAVDVRGQGRTTWTPGRYSFDNMGNDLVRFITQVIRRPVVVSGNSSGGILAGWLSAYALPGQIRGALLEDPPLFSGERVPLYGQSMRQSSGPILELFQRHIGDQWSIGDWQGFTRAAKASASPLAQMMGSFEEVPQNFKEYDPEWSSSFLSGQMSETLRNERLLASVRTPVLLTHHARAIHPVTGNLIGALSDFQAEKARELIETTGVSFEYLSLPDAMHAMHTTDPEQFSRTLKEWASRLPPAGNEGTAL